MTAQPPNPELQEALLELQQYLSDSVPPLVVADSVQLLMKYPPQALIPTIRAWTAAQYRGAAASSVPLSDYLFHALKKIHMMGEFRLVAREPLEAYLGQLKQVVLALCPDEDKAMLLESLARLGEAAGATSISPAQNIHRQAPGVEGRAAPSASSGPGAPRGVEAVAAAASADALRRFSVLLERLEAQGAIGATGATGPVPAGGAAAGAVPEAGGAVAVPVRAPAAQAEALVFAARSAHSNEELTHYLTRFREMGLDANTDNLFRALAQSLPGWVLPGAGGTASPLAGMETGALGAMRRIVSDADDPIEAGKRFQEMVKAGIERFNEGSLPQAVAMLELADKLITEKKVDRGSAEIVRRKLGDTLDPEQLKKVAEVPEQHALLRTVLRFFTTMTPEGLLEELKHEQKRDRRRLILLLAEVHGPPTRAASYEHLTHSRGPATGEEEWFFRRNLLYLLRRIPRDASSPPVEAEADVLLQHAQMGLPLLVVKEAIAALGQLKDEKTETGLVHLLGDIEAMLAKPEEAPYEAKDLRILLDRVAATMARMPSQQVRRSLLEHAGKRQTYLGDTMSRLADLGTQNLSDDPGTVEMLLAVVKANLPFKLLGMTLRQNDQNLVHAVEALGGTPLPPVRKALEDIASRFAGQDAGKTATRVLSGFDKAPQPAAASEAAAPEAAASLQGDLEVFGLPALLQSLSDSAASGVLTLRGPKGGEIFGMLTLREGKLQECSRAHLKGDDAFYQLLEKPSQGQFAFVKGSVASKPGVTPREVLPLTLEAMRRYDEFQEMAALVPDIVQLDPTTTKPSAHPNEKDGTFLQALWERASQGGTPEEIEKAVASDSYRIRRVLAHWVEQGALKIRASA
ncbi:MAG TPA: DUF4388 domain-containing protein [Thermoanaerobaculia bacterium]|jgi:hypothetical protein